MRPVQAVLLSLILVVMVSVIWWMTRLDGTTPRTAGPLTLTDAGPVAGEVSAGDLAAVDTSAGDARAADDGGARSVVERDGAVTEEVAAAAHRRAGVVLDAAGRPVAGAAVYYVASGGGGGFVDRVGLDALYYAGSRFGMEIGMVETDAQGRYVLESSDSKPLGVLMSTRPKKQDASMRVAVRASGHAPYDGELARPARGEDYEAIHLQPTVLLEGRVFDHVGRPVEGAIVTLLPPRTAGMMVHFSAGDDEGAELGWVTDAAGRFMVDRLAAGPYRLRAKHVDAPPEEVSGSCAEVGGRVSGVEIHLEEGLELRGRVVGLADGEVADYVVHASPAGGMFDGDGPPETHTVDLAEDGGFRMRGVRRGGLFEVGLFRRDADDGFWGNGAAEKVTARAGDSRVVLEYRGVTGLRLRAVDAETGEPVEDFELSAGGWWAEPLTDEDDTVITHHPGGVAEYPGVQTQDDGKFQLVVKSEGYATLEIDDRKIPAGEVLDLGDVRLHPVPEILVRVVDRATGKPVRGARVALHLERDGERADFVVSGWNSRDGEDSDRTDEDGIARLSSRPGEVGYFKVGHKSYADLRSPTRIFASTPPAEPIELQLSRGGSVVVTVLDAAGNPLGDRSVERRSLESEEALDVYLRSESSEQSSGNGEARFRHLPEGPHAFRIAKVHSPSEVVFVSSIDDDSPQPLSDEWKTVVVQEGGDHELTLYAAPSATLRGRILENGRPLVGARVTIRSTEGDEGPGGFLVPGFGGHGIETDSEGRFATEDREVGPVRLSIEHPLRAMPAVYDLELEAGENEAEFDLDVCILRGRVVDEDGRPVVGASISVERVSGELQQFGREVIMYSTVGATIVSGTGAGDPSVTDADGRYELRGVAPGVALRLACDARGPFLKDGELELAALDAAEVRDVDDLELKGGGSLRVVVARGTVPLGFCSVSVRALDEELGGESHQQYSQGAGEVSFEGLQAGRWSVEVTNHPMGEGESTEAEPREVTIEAGQEARVDVVLP